MFDCLVRGPPWIQRLETKIDQLLVLVRASREWEERAMSAINDLEAKVEEVETVEQSAIMLIENISQMLKDAGSNPVKLAEIIATLDAGKTRLADAIVANTPAEPTP